jgi:hypothetical protein
MRAGISESTRPAAAKELDRPQIINNRPLAVSLPRPDEFLRLRPKSTSFCCKRMASNGYKSTSLALIIHAAA